MKKLALILGLMTIASLVLISCTSTTTTTTTMTTTATTATTMTTTATTTTTMTATATTALLPNTTALIPRAVTYLEGNLNHNINLLCESPDDSNSMLHKTYWLANDNLLASYALKSVNSVLSNDLMISIEKWGYRHDHYIEILFGNRTVEPTHAVDNNNPIIIEQNDDHIIQTENVTANIMGDFADYLDKLCYEALWDAYGGSQQDEQDANGLFDQIPNMWYEKGFQDKGFNTAAGYETYKLALCYYTAKVLGRLDNLKFKDNLLTILNMLQAPSGGIYTHYSFDSNGILQHSGL